MRNLPAGALSAPLVCTLMAVLAGARNARDVADLVGWASHVTAYDHLHRLRTLGLVAWEPYQMNTLRPLVAIIPHRRP